MNRDILITSTSKGTSALVFALLLLVAGGILFSAYLQTYPTGRISLSKFDSCSALVDAFKQSYEQSRTYPVMFRTMGAAVPMAGITEAMPDYSLTNVQVEGVDEADIVKTDGEFIYTISGKKLIIAKAYPADEAQIVSETDLGELQPSEIFIDKDTLLIFGSTHSKVSIRENGAKEIYPYYMSLTTVELWDIKDRANPKLVRSVDFEGSYLASRKIESQVYFVVNAYPRYHVLENESQEEIIPMYRDRSAQEIGAAESKEFTKTCRCADVWYFEPVNPQNFVTVVSMSMSDVNASINKEVIVGSGQNIYASLQNLYIAEMNYPYWRYWALGGTPEEKTIIHKFALSGEKISYIGYMEAPGRILNQFSMDEYNNYFRIATTKGHVSRGGGDSTNNIYIYSENLNLTGSLEGLAPGERIYSARFMGDRGYLVTFKKVDPLFAIDLSDPKNPRILGKLKIPGYSDYIHPYDYNHLIGIGKETVEAEEGDFAWYQGLKMAIFDVTDVENPRELHKVVIGDRGTDSYALHDHKAFLFDREKNLLVIPILLAEIKGDKEKLPEWTSGDFVFQGAYVYTLTLDNGFDLRGRITHYEDNETFKKSGYYFYGDASVQRSLYIDDILYTLSQKKIKLNSLEDLAEIKELKFGS